MPGPQAVTAEAVMPPIKTRRMCRLRFTGGWKPSAQHGGSNDEADPENDRAGDDRGGDIPVLENFLVKVARGAFVEYLVASDGKDDAYDGEQHHGPSRRNVGRLQVGLPP